MRTAIEILEAKIPEIKTRKSDYSVMDIRVMNVLEIMEEYANQSKWISAKTEKPEARKDVPHLSINVIGRDVVNSMECFFNYYQKRWYDANGNNVIIIEWQPFPTAP